jgi:plastocyanin
MSGIVVVTPSSLNDSVVVRVGSGDSLVFRPNVVDIKSGGKVRWVNVSAMTNHTVTR